MNLLFKPFILNIFITILLAVFIDQIGGYFLSNNSIEFIADNKKITKIDFDISTAMNIKQKQTIKVETKKAVQKSSGIFLLKDFSISATFLDGDDSLVIVRDSKGGIFVGINEFYKGYKLIEVFTAKAKFEKNKDIYFAFLTPKGEKSFKSVAKKTITLKSKNKKQAIRNTISRSMFEDVKYKNGKYYIPKDMMISYKNMDKIFREISIQARILNSKIKFKVNYVKPQSVFEKIGLRKNDYIVKINNNDFKSISEPIKYFQKLENITELSLTILRGNQTKELKYEVY